MRRMALTLTTAQSQLDAWVAASAAVATAGQSYTINGRTLTRANANEIRQMIDYWSTKVSQLEEKAAGRSRVAVPRLRF